MEKKLGLAIIGAGRIGSTRARVAAQYPACRIVAVADINVDRAVELGNAVGAEFTGDDVGKAVSHPGVDAVLVATPEHTHTQPVIAALAAHKPVMCDTPMALNVRDAAAMERAANAYGVPLCFAYTQRFQRQYQVAKDNVQRGALGRILGGTVRVYNSRAPTFQILKRCPQVTPVVDILTYWVDMVCWLMEGNRVVEVFARGNGEVLRSAGYSADDIVWAILTFTDGAVVSAGIAYALPEQYPSLGQSPRLELIGTQGALLLDDERKNHFMYSEHGVMHGYVPNHSVKAAFLGSSSFGDWAQGTLWGPLADETRAFVDFVLTGRPGTIPQAQEARRTLEITLAIEESARTCKVVKLPFPEPA
ncbi:MAG: Gfo/Idh/MocA family oxidoreductase [Betaproteobacteria bacterium]|nr:Gfo/Idh/MocA family oxidoreductase [Betaproteobacteria bacterium]